MDRIYRAPLKDIGFLLHRLLRVGELAKLPRYAEFSGELADSVLAEGARFAEEVLEPANRDGDRIGAVFSDGVVRSPDSFRDAYARFVEGGWPQLAADAEIGGQGMPVILSTAVEELWTGSNLAFALCPGLARGAIETIQHAGTPELKARFLPRLVDGRWTGTMNLTEPHAGSDVGLLRTRARAEGDHYRIVGQKMFITFAEHDMAENIVHLVLARIEGAPAGVRGISLFVVPKYLPAPDGSPGEPNDLRCVSIEHKLGIHGAPTCVMSYGDNGGAIGYIVGEPNRGLEAMFVMMNAARLGVGMQAVAQSERAAQQALAWATTRLQGRSPGAPGEGPQRIIEHPDVRRMLLTLQSGTEAMRAVAYYGALQLDLARGLPDKAARRAALARADILTPIIKGWSTERSVELASMAIQVHGGMGYVEETGVAQTLRDTRVTAIYEGTTAIQANDLLRRKLALDNGEAFRALLAEAAAQLAAAPAATAPAGGASNGTTLAPLCRAVTDAMRELGDSADALVAQLAQRPLEAYALAVPFLMMCGDVLGGWLLVQSARLLEADAAAGNDFAAAKLQKARFHVEHVLPFARTRGALIRAGGGAVVSDAAVRLLEIAPA
ncbi:MAG: acyl-CoA dehydrogenase [Steroidobacteraceae bacterium]